MVKLRLTLTGRKHYHTFRMVAAETANPRDGSYIEILGTYNPNLANTDANKFQFKKERVEHWLGKGAQPSLTVWNLLRKHGINKATTKALRKKVSAPSA